MQINNVIRYTGEGSVPFDIRNRREASMETMRRLGTPVIIKHRFTIDDVGKGIAVQTGDTSMQAAPHGDIASRGTNYASTEGHPEEWLDPRGELHIAPTPQEGWIQAPMYKGYGPGYLTYCILPDAPEDIFKVTPAGALLHTEVSRAQLPWWPYCGDGDLLIAVELDASEKVLQAFERYELKKVTPITMRGENRWGEREFGAPNLGGNRFWIGQQCEAAKVPETDPIYEVEVDR